MLPNFTQGIVIVVIWGDIFGSFVLFVKKGLRRNILRTYGAYPANSIVVRVRHARSRENVTKGQADVRAIQLGSSVIVRSEGFSIEIRFSTAS